MLKRRIQREDGGTLLIVLVLTGIFGLVIAGLLTESGVSIAYTKTVSDHEKKVYAADAGVSVGIQQVRLRNDLCPAPGASGSITMTTPASAGVPAATVTCTGTQGSSLGAKGHSIMVTKSSAGVPGKLTTQSGGGVEKILQGPVFVEGSLDLSAPVKVLRGSFTQYGGSCTAATPGAVTVADVGYFYACLTDPALIPVVPDHVAPSAVPATVNPAPTMSAGCRIFSPGTYTSPPALIDGNNYFQSGVYYFNFDGQWVVGANQKVWGGQNSAQETPNFALPACATDATPSGSGVVWAFAKTGALYVNKGQVEIFTRQDPANLSGSSGMSLVAVPADWPAAWTKSTAGTLVIDIASGSNSDLSIHGLVYAPDQAISLWATNGVAAQVLGGVVGNEVILQASAAASGMAVSVVGDKPDPRYVTVKASVPGSAGSKPVESTATIKLENDMTMPPEILSWRTRGIPDPT